MHAHKALLHRFYSAFQERDGAAMAACYHPQVRFSDPVFPDLRGEQAGAMWRMLCERGKDLRIEFDDVHIEDGQGSVRWQARYSFSATGRPVHNRIRGQFRFTDDVISEHRDYFPFWTWSRMALGAPGLLLGWTPLLRRKVQRTARAQLDSFLRAQHS